MSDEIQIEPYDPAWPALYVDEARRLGSVLPGGTLLTIEHIGSTAVPALAAKPVIDLMGLVRSLKVARQYLVGPIEALGYAYWADNPATDRMFFVRGLPPRAESHSPPSSGRATVRVASPPGLPR